jgi:hypothetical protein
MMKRLRENVPETLLVVFALLLRVTFLGKPVLSSSEARLWLFTTDSWENLFSLFRNGGEHVSGTLFPYLVFMKFWTGAGRSEAWLRAPSAFFGVLTVLLVYLLARRLFGRGAGLLAGAIFAMMPLHVMISRTAGSSALGMFLLVLALYLFHMVQEDEARAGVSAAFAVVMLAGVGFGYYQVLILIPLNILFIGFAKNRNRSRIAWWILLNACLVAVVAYSARRWGLAWFMLTGPEKAEPVLDLLPKENMVFAAQQFQFMLKYLWVFVRTIGFFPSGQLQNIFAFLGLPLMLVIGHFFIFIGFREYEDGYRPRVFSFILLGCLFAQALAATYTAMIKTPWEVVIPVTVMLCAVIANGAVRFASWRSKALLGLLLLCVLAGFVPAVRSVENARPDWKKISATVSADAYPLLFVEAEPAMPIRYYGGDLERRTVILSNTSDIGLSTMDKGVEEVSRFLGVTLDGQAPDGARQVFRRAPRVWYFQQGDEVPETPRWAREYSIWIRDHSKLIGKTKLGPDSVLKLMEFNKGSRDRR